MNRPALDARYRQAAWAYAAYGVLYWLGGLGSWPPAEDPEAWSAVGGAGSSWGRCSS